MNEADQRKLACLSDAANLKTRKGNGLLRTVAGWATGSTATSWHHFRTVSGLVDAGHLEHWQKGRIAMITESGAAELNRLRALSKNRRRQAKDKRSATKAARQPVERACRVCGCTENNACITDGVPCHWVGPALCSACA